MKASAVRKLAPVRDQLLARADIMQDEAQDRFFAQTVFGAAERSLGAAAREPERAGDLLDGVLNLIAQTPLSEARKDQVATAVAAQAIRRNVGGGLGRLSRFHKSAERLLGELDAEDEAAAAGTVETPGVGAVSAPAETSAEVRSDEAMPSTEPQSEEPGTGLMGEAAAVSSVQPERIQPARSISDFKKALTRTGIGALTGAAAWLAGLSSLFLVGTTGPAGTEPQVRETTSQDGRRFVLETFEDEGRGRLTIVDPAGEEVGFDIKGVVGGGVLRFSHGTISMGDGRQLPLTGGELADVIDGVADEFAGAGLRIEIADEDEQGTSGGDGQNDGENQSDGDDTEEKLRVTNPEKAESPIWQGLEHHKGKTKRSGKGKKRRLYEWDHTHNEIEVYDRNGQHLGAMDHTTGEMIKLHDPGRSIKK